MKIQVETIKADTVDHDYKEGEQGFVDGYIRGADNRPYACVVFKDRIVMVALGHLKPINTAP